MENLEVESRIAHIYREWSNGVHYTLSTSENARVASHTRALLSKKGNSAL